MACCAQHFSQLLSAKVSGQRVAAAVADQHHHQQQPQHTQGDGPAEHSSRNGAVPHRQQEAASSQHPRHHQQAPTQGGQARGLHQRRAQRGSQPLRHARRWLGLGVRSCSAYQHRVVQHERLLHQHRDRQSQASRSTAHRHNIVPETARYIAPARAQLTQCTHNRSNRAAITHDPAQHTPAVSQRQRRSCS